MKVIYSYLKKFLPELSIPPQELRDDLTMIGHFTNYFEEIEGEIVFDLDIKVNRGDCFGYYGIAKDLSVYYDIPLKIPEVNLPSPIKKENLPIKIETDNVKRVMAVKISGLKNTISPKWLQTFVKCHSNTPINTIVDLTNYIMFIYGLPPHAFDTNKSTDKLIWQMNPKYKEFTTLDGSKLNLNKEVLMINNSQEALSLSFWGGEASAIDLSTQEAIIEIAIYNPNIVRQNSRSIKAITEAETRLEKKLDTESIPLAFKHLINLILENCQGQISSNIFDHYPQKRKLPQIEFDYKRPSIISGINIPETFSKTCLKKLGCQIDDTLITPPSIRTDITIEDDLTEEVIRFWGYQKIPTNQPLKFKKVPDITPKEIYLIERLKDQLTDLGYDEVLTWPLVDKVIDKKTIIKTQNSINTEVVYLRQSLIPSLKKQKKQYQRYKLNSSKFFEISKVFSKENNKFIEKNSLAIYCNDKNQLILDLERLNLKGNIVDSNYFEIIIDDLQKPQSYNPKQINYSAYELTSQIITLDANITLEKKEDPVKLIKEYQFKIGLDNLWEIIITDLYQDPKNNKYRYTFRVSYFNIDDKTAKKIHLKAFDLN